MAHKSGFVSIIGKPNVGKSTLINILVGEKLSIITSKAQTTRHRILGIVSTDDYQVIFSDTPGIIKPRYLLQESMMNAVEESLQGGDVVIYVTAWDERGDNEEIEKRLSKNKAPVICILNKIDLSATQEEVVARTQELQEKYNPVKVIPVSAKESFNVQHIFPAILELLPEGPEYYPKDQFTDRPERFFASEIIREKIFILLKEELPYSCEVDIMQFVEEEKIIRIHADIYVLRDSQKPIVIGAQGKNLKRIGIGARKDLEAFFGKQVYLETYVKVRENWRDEKKYLKSFGYPD